MKKGDFLIYGLIFLLAVLLAAAFMPGKQGKAVVIKQNNETVCRVLLEENRTVELSENIIEISDGSVKMKSARCKNQVCVHHLPISRQGETIACLPNGVTVTVE